VIKFFHILLFIGVFGLSHNVFAQSEFCKGFEEGYKIVKGDMVLVPLCPLEPLTPLGSNPYREGIKEGMKAAAN